MAESGKELLGEHQSLKQFPLLLKFLDAKQSLSVQVHPDDAYASALTPPQLGKTECWVIIEAEPDSKIYAGLKPGVDRLALEAAIAKGRCEECLSETSPKPGDCYFLPAGTVHALGKGLLVAEIQQSSGITYRLFDWNRVGADGRPRPLHIQQALDVIDFNRGPVLPQRAQPASGNHRARLVECSYFGVEQWTFDTPQTIGGDGRCHILCVIGGSLQVKGDPADLPLDKGGTVLLPAALGKTRLTPQGQTTLLTYDIP
jgi:mannose-6-phosphate isomerase